MKHLLLLAVVAVGAIAAPAGVGSLQPPGDLRTEYAVNPLGLEARQPSLSWKLHSNQRGARQSAYQIQVASSVAELRRGQAGLWDSGKVASDQSVQVPYRGSPLASRQRCAWKVRVWDAEGQPTAYSEPSTWEMGLLQPKDWQAEWIGWPAGWIGRALYFRYDFEVTKEATLARAYTAGVGYHDLHLNGAKVGDHVLDPGYTDYAKRVLYATHDVTAWVRRGKNTVGAVVGNGWYGMPKLLLQLELTYTDGGRETIATSGFRAGETGRWRVTNGPIVMNSVFDGETYDARLEKSEWDLPGGEARQKGLDRSARFSLCRPAWSSKPSRLSSSRCSSYRAASPASRPRRIPM